MSVRFNANELETIRHKAKQSGMRLTSFIRTAVIGTKIKEAPPADYYSLIQEVRKVGININQIQKKANALGFIDMSMLKKALENNHKTEAMLWKVFENL